MALNPFKPFATYLRPYRRRVTAGLLLLVVAQAIITVLPLILKEAIDQARAAFADGAAPGAIDAAMGQVGTLAWVVAALALVGWVVNFGMRWNFTSASRLVERDLRRAYVRHLHLLPLRAIEAAQAGDLMARATNDVEAIQRFLHNGFRMTMMGLLTFFLSLALMAAIDWQLALVALLPMPVVVVASNLVSSRVRQRYRLVQEQFAAMSAWIQENLSGIRVVKAFSREPAELAAFAQLNEEYVGRNRHLAIVEGLFFPFTILLNGVSLAVVLWLGGLAVLDGSLTLGAFVAFNAYLIRMSRPMYLLGRMVADYQRAIASLGRVEAILELTPEDRADRPGSRLHGEIELRDVVVSYSGAPAMDRVSLRIPAGGTLGVVGRVGSGKSTLARLVARLREADRGQVLIDGVDVRELPLSTLRDAIGYVPQDSFLFSDTLRANIALGLDEDDERSAEPGSVSAGPGRVEWASEASRLSADLEDMPAGLETVVGERGITLSGGQRQRTALARALVRNPAILILDDALASVDARTEAQILEQLHEIAASRTTILISHRLSTVREADQIIVLDDGRIVEAGTHDQLVAAGGTYAGIHRRQTLTSELDEI